MIPASALLQEAARYSQTVSVRVDVYRGRVMTTPKAPIVEGKISADRGDKSRLSCDMTLAQNLWEPDIVGVKGYQLHVSVGVESLGTQERIPLGWFRVDEVARGSDGTVSVKASGRESFVIDARLLRPRTPSFGQSTVGEIVALIREAVPSAQIRPRNTIDRLIDITTPWDRDRWGAIDALAKTIEAEVFCDYTGAYVIADEPSLVTGVPVVRFTEGEGGLLVTRMQSDTREQVYNAVSVIGTSTDPNVPELYGLAVDTDPNSPTFYYADPLDGGFGQVPRFYSSGWFTAAWQCDRTANKFLVDSLAANQKLEFDSLPLPFLEVNDIVEVQMRDGSIAVHLIDDITYDLSGNASMSCLTRSTKVEARETD